MTYEELLIEEAELAALEAELDIEAEKHLNERFERWLELCAEEGIDPNEDGGRFDFILEG